MARGRAHQGSLARAAPVRPARAHRRRSSSASLTLGLIARLFLLQVIRHDYYTDLSQGNRVRTEPIPASRGLILDRNGELLAGNQPAYQLELVPEEVPDLGETLDGLVELGLIRAEDVERARSAPSAPSRGFDSVPIRLRMSEEDVARFAVRRFEFPGVDIKTRQTRFYPNGDLRGARARLRRRDQRAGPQAHRSRRLRRHLADRQAGRRERLRTRSCTAPTASGKCSSTPRAARCDRQGAFVPNLQHQGAHAGRRSDPRDRPEGRSGRPKRHSPGSAARSSRSIRTTATCSRS